MRRAKLIAAIAAPVLGAAMLAACSSSGGSGSPGANADVAVTGTYGKAPTVKIPSKSPGSALTVKTLVNGTGPAVSSTAAFVANYVFYTWDGTSHKLVENTFSSNPQLMAGSLIPGLTTALNGKKVGSRVLAVVPPADAYGSQGDTQEGISPNSTMVFVVDLLGVFGSNEDVSGTQVNAGAGLPAVSDITGSAPTITIPASAPPTSLTVKTLVQGTGPAVKGGQYIVVQYTGVDWRTGKVFDSSWSRKAPLGFAVGEAGSVILGLDTGLEGVRVGSRVLLVVPPADGYGSKGVSSAGITGTDTLVFAVDVLGAFG
ncbi:MAG TPA: FKBP-type peptidyl-prolyl cis-trans isomerase [Streptosporangiaceae bacterium]